MVRQWSTSQDPLRSILRLVSKDSGRSFKKINKFKMRISVPYVGVMAPKAENTFSPLHISILVKSKNYFAIMFKFLCGF